MDRDEPSSTHLYEHDSLYHNYNLSRKDRDFFVYYFRLPVPSRLIEYMRMSRQQSNMLDLGSGSGIDSHYLQKRLPSSRVFSLELSSLGLSKGRTDLHLEHQTQGTALDLPFASNTFRAIHCKDMLIHVRDRDRLFSEISRVLEYNGRLALISGTAYEELGQIPWNRAEIISLAEKNRLLLIDEDKRQFEKDDWYKKPMQRSMWLFNKMPKPIWR